MGVVTGILDVAGTIPVVQDFTDPVSAVVSLTQGDYAGAGLALTGMIPGVGEAADIAKAAKDVEHVVKETEGAAKEGENLAKCAEGQCFIVGTLISTPDGEKPIEQITPGDQVYAYDFQQGKVVASHVLAIYRNTTTAWDDLTFQDGETVHATPNHPFWIESMQSWVGASQLKPGMEVQLENGRGEAVLSNVLRPLSKPETTYNFQVENEHDYFVGLGQILVHNACQASGLPKPPKGKGSVPKPDRDPKRGATQGDKAQMHVDQDGTCANCNQPLAIEDSIGHHTPIRHADGGSEMKLVCKPCHADLHK